MKNKKNKTKQNQTARIILYLLFFGLLLFELLNYFKILNYEVTFTWSGLIITIIMIFIGLQAVIYYTKHNFGISIANRTLLVVVIGIYLDVISDMFDLYDRFIWFDQAVHFNAGILITIILFWFISRIEATNKIYLPQKLKYLFIFCANLTLGVTYEMEEYLEDYFTGSNRLGDGPDTANDLLMAGTAGIITLIIIHFIAKKIKNKKNAGS